MPERSGSGSGEAEVLSGAPALHRAWIGNPEAHQPFLFQARQRRIDRPDGNRPTRARFDFTADGDAVRLVSQVGQGEHHVEFEFADEIAFWHIYSTNAYLDVRNSRMVYRRRLQMPRTSNPKGAKNDSVLSTRADPRRRVGLTLPGDWHTLFMLVSTKAPE
jgi:hypothetical protein